jgi:hypothetical protein
MANRQSPQNSSGQASAGQGQAGKSYAGGFYAGGQPDETPVQPQGPVQAQSPAAQSDVPRELAPDDDDIDPIIDQWYQRGDTQEMFVVTDYDERAGTIEIQTAAGDLDELDLETWRSIPLVLAEQSQDWTEIIDNEPANDDAEPGPDEGARPEDDIDAERYK